jgi:predicted pyridoxine 5'-phosphate oxidase superfamily flavin-nucleotide-binding protein
VIKLTPLMRELFDTALAEGHEALLGSVAADGTPQISPKGSIAVFDDTTLSFWERSHRSTEANLKANPRVVVYYRNAARMKEIPYGGGAFRVYGTARIVTDPATTAKVWERTNETEQSRDKDKTGVGVLIDVDRVEELSGKVVMDKNG